MRVCRSAGARVDSRDGATATRRRNTLSGGSLLSCDTAAEVACRRPRQTSLQMYHTRYR